MIDTDRSPIPNGGNKNLLADSPPPNDLDNDRFELPSPPAPDPESQQLMNRSREYLNSALQSRELIAISTKEALKERPDLEKYWKWKLQFHAREPAASDKPYSSKYFTDLLRGIAARPPQEREGQQYYPYDACVDMLIAFGATIDGENTVTLPPEYYTEPLQAFHPDYIDVAKYWDTASIKKIFYYLPDGTFASTDILVTEMETNSWIAIDASSAWHDTTKKAAEKFSYGLSVLEQWKTKGIKGSRISFATELSPNTETGISTFFRDQYIASLPSGIAEILNSSKSDKAKQTLISSQFPSINTKQLFSKLSDIDLLQRQLYSSNDTLSKKTLTYTCAQSGLNAIQIEKLFCSNLGIDSILSDDMHVYMQAHGWDGDLDAMFDSMSHAVVRNKLLLHKINEVRKRNGLPSIEKRFVGIIFDGMGINGHAADPNMQKIDADPPNLNQIHQGSHAEHTEYLMDILGILAQTEGRGNTLSEAGFSMGGGASKVITGKITERIDMQWKDHLYREIEELIKQRNSILSLQTAPNSSVIVPKEHSDEIAFHPDYVIGAESATGTQLIHLNIRILQLQERLRQELPDVLTDSTVLNDPSIDIPQVSVFGYVPCDNDTDIFLIHSNMGNPAAIQIQKGAIILIGTTYGMLRDKIPGNAITDIPVGAVTDLFTRKQLLRVKKSRNPYSQHFVDRVAEAHVASFLRKDKHGKAQNAQTIQDQANGIAYWKGVSKEHIEAINKGYIVTAFALGDRDELVGYEKAIKAAQEQKIRSPYFRFSLNHWLHVSDEWLQSPMNELYGGLVKPDQLRQLHELWAKLVDIRVGIKDNQLVETMSSIDFEQRVKNWDSHITQLDADEWIQRDLIYREIDRLSEDEVLRDLIMNATKFIEPHLMFPGRKMNLSKLARKMPGRLKEVLSRPDASISQKS